MHTPGCRARREEIAWTVQTLSVNALELSRLWEHTGFSTCKLTDVQEKAFHEQLPMQVRACTLWCLGGSARDAALFACWRTWCGAHGAASPAHPLGLQAETFRQYQAECTEVVKSMLWTSWAPKSVELFNRLPPVFINGDSVRPPAARVTQAAGSDDASLTRGQLMAWWQRRRCACEDPLPTNATPCVGLGCCCVQDAYYRAVCTLQSNQLRSLLQRSLDA